MAIVPLYVNYKNQKVTSHSYSGGTTFRFCKRRYQLERIKGWREKDNKASTHFGTCVESALQYHVNNKLTGGEDEFHRLWTKIKQIEGLTYTEKERDWDTVNRMGSDMLRLFDRWYPNMKFEDPKWQLEYKKEVFPNSQYAGINFTAYVDLRAKHAGELTVIDIKTAGSMFTDNPNMLKLDPQLADYAWVTGIPNVAFLTFVKSASTEFKKGDRVTVLGNNAEGIVGFSESDKQVAAVFSEEDAFLKYGEEMDKVEGGKGKKEREDAIKTKWKNSPVAYMMRHENLTKVKIQFLKTTIPDDMIKEAGEVEGQNIVDIVQASTTNRWPQDGKGIRFPNNKCTICPMRGICMGDDKVRDELLINLAQPKTATPAKDEDNWLDQIGE